MKVGFNVKYGYNEIEIPITENTAPKFQKNGLSSLFSQKVTIYNDIHTDIRRFDRFVIDKCSIQGGFIEKADGTLQTVVNAKTVITRDMRYKPPHEYAKLTLDEREMFYTVQVDDFIVLAEVDDAVTSIREFQDLQEKYSQIGFLVTSVNPHIQGTAVDNISITNV